MGGFEVTMRLGENQRAVERLDTNEAILAAWSPYARTHFADTVFESVWYQVKRFLSTLTENGILATDMQSADFWTYLDRYMQRCRFLWPRLYKSGQTHCRAKQDPAGCGLSCPAYRPATHNAVKKHLHALDSLYEFLALRGHIPFNAVQAVKKKWLKDNRHRDRPSKRRLPTREEVEALVNKTPHPPWKILYALSAKTGMRRAEMLRLTVDPECLDLEAGWLHIPVAEDKRKGNRSCPLDPETVRLLKWYMEWRSRHVRRDERGRPVTRQLLVTMLGTPMQHRRVSPHLHKDCVRLGITPPDATMTERLTHHCLRHFFSDWLADAKCPQYWWQVLRGESLKGTTQGAYNHIKPDKLREIYLQYRPRFTIIQPVSYPSISGCPRNASGAPTGPMMELSTQAVEAAA